MLLIETKIFESDTILKSVKDFVKKGWRHRNPMLVLLVNSDKSQFFDLKNTTCNGKRLTVLPVNEIFENEEIKIQPENILLNPGIFNICSFCYFIN